MAVTADGPLLISPEILAHLRVGLLDDLSIAAKNLRALVACVDTDVTNGAVDVDAKHLDLYELTRMIETSSLLQPLAGWPGTPADELHLENGQHRKLAVDALTRHRERLVEQLLSDALPHGDKAPLIAQVQALTAFLRNIGATQSVPALARELRRQAPPPRRGPVGE